MMKRLLVGFMILNSVFAGDGKGILGPTTQTAVVAINLDRGITLNQINVITLKCLYVNKNSLLNRLFNQLELLDQYPEFLAGLRKNPQISLTGIRTSSFSFDFSSDYIELKLAPNKKMMLSINLPRIKAGKVEYEIDDFAQYKNHTGFATDLKIEPAGDERSEIINMNTKRTLPNLFINTKDYTNCLINELTNGVR